MRRSRSLSTTTALLAAVYWLGAARAGTAASLPADQAAYGAAPRPTGPRRSTQAWDPRDFRLSEDDFCHDGTREIRIRSCWDPDGILAVPGFPEGGDTRGENSLEALNKSLQRETYFVSPCPEQGQRGELVPLQLAVAVVGKMKVEDAGDASFIDKAAEAFARSVHDQWGVGQETRCGGTGVVLFVSIQDRAIYVSRGDALKRILTDRRLDTVIDDISPYLQSELYVRALAHAIEEIRVLVEHGEARFGERLLDLLSYYGGFLWIFGIFSFVIWSNRKHERRKREYAKVKSCLSEIDRAKAEALQGRFAAVSCPICLEGFQGKPKHNEDGRLLGSDGEPVRLLRCGHTFDETCWTEWMDSGQGEVHKCPICKADVGKPLEDIVSPWDEANTTTSRGTAALVRASANDASTPPSAVVDRYEDERNFRLCRLHHRYPRIVRADLVERWMHSSYNTPFTTDARLAELDPSHDLADRTDPSSIQHSNASQSGFSGGSSGGGRGGRW